MKAIKHFAMSFIFIVPSGSHRNRGDTQSGNQNHLATTAWMRAWNAPPVHLSSLSLLATRETAVEGTPRPETRHTQCWTPWKGLLVSHPIPLLVPACCTVPGTGVGYVNKCHHWKWLQLWRMTQTVLAWEKRSLTPCSLSSLDFPLQHEPNLLGTTMSHCKHVSVQMHSTRHVSKI